VLRLGWLAQSGRVLDYWTLRGGVLSRLFLRSIFDACVVEPVQSPAPSLRYRDRGLRAQACSERQKTSPRVHAEVEELRIDCYIVHPTGYLG
jgi:hypothetical protein